jgi:arylsulfatase A
MLTSMMPRLWVAAVLVWSPTAALIATAADATTIPARRPNVIVIMADDLGWGDVSCNGATAVQTPHIDRLAREGIRFTSGYCSASTCTPTRYSLLTGEYAFRRPGTGIASPNAAAIIQPDRTTFASMLKDAGYATAVIGKWHLGLGEKSAGPDWNGRLVPGPLEIGFDHCFLLPTTNDRVPQVFVEDHVVKNLDPADPLWVGDTKPVMDHPNGVDNRDQLRMDWSVGHNNTIHNGIGRIGFSTGGTQARFRDEDLADAWVRESVCWIEAHARTESRPFFLLLTPHDIHVPRVPHERFQGTTRLGPRGDCVMELDWIVGEVTAAVDRLGLAADTLIVFCSDNGPVLDDGYKDDAVAKLGDHRPAGPFRDGKYSVYEGGTRTPFIARWPGRIAPGVSDAIVCTIDLATSVAAIIGATVPAGAFPDAVDLSAALLGTGAGRRSLLQQDNGLSGRFGLRDGAWKLVRQPPPKRSKGQHARPVDALYDLTTDTGETKNVRDTHPDIAARLGAELERIIAAQATATPSPATSTH